MDTTNTALQESYAALRLAARCDQDIMTWYQEHPHLIPGVPAGYAADVELRMSADTDPNRVSQYEDKLYRHVHLRYTLINTEQTSSNQVEWEGSLLALSPVNVMVNHEGYFNVFLPLETWPYALAAAASDYFYDYPDFSTGSSTALMGPYLEKTWATLFPHLPWESLCSMEAAGLVPEEQEPFIELVMNPDNLSKYQLLFPEQVSDFTRAGEREMTQRTSQ